MAKSYACVTCASQMQRKAKHERELAALAGIDTPGAAFARTKIHNEQRALAVTTKAHAKTCSR